MQKVVPLEVIKQFKEFYEDKSMKELSKSVFFKCDIRISNSNKSSKIS